MFEIIYKQNLSKNIYLYKINAPLIAKKAQSGQFLVLRVDEFGERFPLTIAGYSREDGTIDIIFQVVGKSTKKLAELEKGAVICDVLGPLGKPTHYGNAKKIAVVGGGLGTAIAYPQAKFLYEQSEKNNSVNSEFIEQNMNNIQVDVIAGFRNKDLIILEPEMRDFSHNLYIGTDDGSNGRKALVTDILRENLNNGAAYDLVIAIGPAIMMKFVCALTREYNIKTIVSLNPIMVDGTGMCGCCRVRVGGETKFACIDGPDFDGHLVDFDNLAQRLRVYDGNHKCKISLDE